VTDKTKTFFIFILLQLSFDNVTEKEHSKQRQLNMPNLFIAQCFYGYSRITLNNQTIATVKQYFLHSR